MSQGNNFPGECTLLVVKMRACISVIVSKEYREYILDGP